MILSMERSNDIEQIANDVTDRIIAKMNLIISNYANTDLVRKEVEKRKLKIKETLDNASKMIDDVNARDDLSVEEVISEMKKIEESTKKKYAKLQHELNLYLEKQRNMKWSKLEQMRFLYLELGKYLEKNTDFFLNDKLDELSLTDEERQAVYDNDLLLIPDPKKRGEIYQVICKSTAIFLQVGLNKLGIVNSKVHTILEEEGIHHWFVVAQDDDKKQYFLTLAADLPFIKNNFPTEHFGTDFPLFDENGNQVYDPYDLDDIRIDLGKFTEECRLLGEKKKGFGIKHEVIPEKKLREIDTKICHGELYESLAYANTKVFKELVAHTYEDNSVINKMFRKCFGFFDGEYDPILNNRNPNILDDKHLFKPMSELKKSDYDDFIGYLKPCVFEFMSSKYPELLNKDSNSDSFLRDALINILNKVRDENIQNKKKKGISDVVCDDDMTYDMIISKNKEIHGTVSRSSYFDAYNVINSLYSIQKNFELYFSLTDKLKEADELAKNAIYDEQHTRIEDVREKITNELIKVQEQLSIRRLNHYLHELSYNIEVRDDVEFPKDKFVPMEDVVRRFQLIFPKVMDMNSDCNVTVSSTNFSKQNYSEQIVIVKRILAMIYPDLTHENSCLCQSYTDKKVKASLYSAVDNRINSYPLKDKSTGEYCIGFTFSPAPNEGIVEFIYVPSTNELRRRNPITDMSKYWIASVRFNDKLQSKVEQAGMLVSEDEEVKELESIVVK